MRTAPASREMEPRSRAKSLPSPRVSSEQVRPMRGSPFPLLGGELSVLRKRDNATRETPPWDREVDVTFHKNTVLREEEFRRDEDPKSTPESVNAQRILKEAFGKGKKTPRVFRNSESFTYAAIISTLNYKEKRKEPDDDTFCKVIDGLHLSHGTDTGNDSHPLFKLPETVRRRIWGYIVLGQPDRTPKPIRLQLFEPFLKVVWRPDDFQSSGELFSHAQGALSSCFSMRTNLLAYVLTTHRFHFTFSPYVKEMICPELFYWVDNYSQFMQHIMIELDLSRLGFGADSAATRLLPGNLHVDTAVRRWVNVQVRRRTMPIQSLVLVARRYHGLRPDATPVFGREVSKPRQYCPPAKDYAAAKAIVRLKGQINIIRIAGFNASTTDCLLASLFPDVDYKAKVQLLDHCHRASISTIWPFLPGQSSIHRDTHFGSVVSPKENWVGNFKYEVKSPARNLSLARTRISKLREMLEASEDKKRRSTEPSVELKRISQSTEKSPLTMSRRTTLAGIVGEAERRADRVSAATIPTA
ncbi:hypothetical protein BJ170DRAFT_595898 [Xylariales sp. AK1849]|nr:hypothetical protein BJ170DRAFT_595898 [Xylariales sp. AK1849]